MGHGGPSSKEASGEGFPDAFDLAIRRKALPTTNRLFPAGIIFFQSPPQEAVCWDQVKNALQPFAQAGTL